MSKSYRPYGKSGTRKGRFVLFHDDMLNSPAFRSLSCQAKCALISLKQRFYGTNNGQISLSCRECATQNKMSRNTAHRALKELEEKGFIQTTSTGWFGTRQASTYRLTMDANKNTLERPTNEWRNWGKSTVSKNSQTVTKNGKDMPYIDTET